MGGVPLRISYDNLKVAVRQILEGRHRIEQEAFLHSRGHYLSDSHFCTPGAGHEKGQVEHRVGYGRRNLMVPLPEVESFEELNAHLALSRDIYAT
jgi:transposase